MRSSTTSIPARHRAQLVATGVTVTRGAQEILTDLDLTVNPASRIAIVGENGRGKSTLLQALTGALEPDAGSIERIGTIGVADQEMDAADERSVREVIADAIADQLTAIAELDAAGVALAEGDNNAAEAYAIALERAEALDAWDAERRVQIALEALGARAAPEARLRHLSVGQRYRVRLACLLGADDDFLLLDEPTNHLDAAALEFLTARLNERRGGVVLVSHDRALLADVADTIVDLDPTFDGRARVYGDGYSGYREGRVAERQRWEQTYEREQAEHARLQESLSAAQNRLVSGWRPEKGSPKHGRATRAGGLVQSVHRRQEDLAAHAVTVPEPPLEFRFPALAVRSGRALLTVENVCVSRRGLAPVSFEVSAHEKLVITGPNGAGKSTLLAVASRELEPETGQVRVAPGTRIGFLRQESALPLDARANEVFDQRLDEAIARGELPEASAPSLSQLGLLKAAERSKRVGELSMGQQRRLDLAIVLARRPHVLLLDEPTNHLSIALVDELTEALHATAAAVVLATHDRQTLRDIAGWQRLSLEARS